MAYSKAGTEKIQDDTGVSYSIGQYKKGKRQKKYASLGWKKKKKIGPRLWTSLLMANSWDCEVCLFTQQSLECVGFPAVFFSHFHQGAALHMGDAPRDHCDQPLSLAQPSKAVLFPVHCGRQNLHLRAVRSWCHIFASHVKSVTSKQSQMNSRSQMLDFKKTDLDQYMIKA